MLTRSGPDLRSAADRSEDRSIVAKVRPMTLRPHPRFTGPKGPVMIVVMDGRGRGQGWLQEALRPRAARRSRRAADQRAGIHRAQRAVSRPATVDLVRRL